jgi:hypothetical protein
MANRHLQGTRRCLGPDIQLQTQILTFPVRAESNIWVYIPAGACRSALNTIQDKKIKALSRPGERFFDSIPDV